MTQISLRRASLESERLTKIWVVAQFPASANVRIVRAHDPGGTLIMATSSPRSPRSIPWYWTEMPGGESRTMRLLPAHAWLAISQKFEWLVVTSRASRAVADVAGMDTWKHDEGIEDARLGGASAAPASHPSHPHDVVGRGRRSHSFPSC